MRRSLRMAMRLMAVVLLLWAVAAAAPSGDPVSSPGFSLG